MKNAIIGTAGHVDHGKTLLIKALTGIDTDRLIEERRRGITIELGFASLALPNGERAGIIDVPGHEKFIKNMLAGAGSIDLALLVVAADEGVMPQTKEHLDILSLLGIGRGAVALTKIDIVEPDWLELVRADVEFKLKGTFLEGAPVLPVSAVTGQGIDELKECLFDLLEKTAQKAAHVPFRLPVDRVFTIDGFGTVVTGTLIEGALSVGDGVTIFPSLKQTKVRNLQVHDQAVSEAHAGQRVAVNLAGLSLDEVQRGDVLAANGSMQNSAVLDVRIDVLKDTKRELRRGSRLHLYHGTRDLLCYLDILDSQRLEAGEHAYARLRLSEPIATKPGDHFVLRFYSPLETVAGGVILDPDSPGRLRRRSSEMSASFEMKDKGQLNQRIAQIVKDRSALFAPLDEIKFRLFNNSPDFDAALKGLIDGGTIVRIIGDRAVHIEYLEAAGMRCQDLLRVYHKENPLHEGMRRDELRQRLLPNADPMLSDRVIDELTKRNVVKAADGRVALTDFSAVMDEQQRRLSDALVKALLDGGFSPPSYDEMALLYPQSKKELKQTFDALVKEGTIAMLTPQICIHRSFYDRAFDAFKALVAQKPDVTLAEFRDSLGTSRKYALALLEHFDLKKLTKKTGDTRCLA